MPPTVQGLIGAIENKYKINATNIRFLYRKNKDGIVAKVDDDMLRHYCNEDVFLMQVLEASFSNNLMYLVTYFQFAILTTLKTRRESYHQTIIETKRYHLFQTP